MQNNEITYLPLARLQKNEGQVPGLPANPRQWTAADVKRIARSLKETPELFEARPIIVLPHGDDYVILGGNLRSEGARQNKMDEVPCYIVPEDTPADKLKEIVIKDNGSFGAWDYDALANEWDNVPLVEWGVPAWEDQPQEEEEAQEDEFDEETDKVQARCLPGDLWQLGDHRLLCGDSTSMIDVQKLMGGGKANLVVTDPPYNVNIESGNGLTIKNDNMASGQFQTFLNNAFSAMTTAMNAGAAFYVWHASRTQREFENALNNAGLQVREQIIWNKNHFVLGRSDYQWKHEPCFYGWKDGAHYFIDSRSETTVYEDSAALDIEKMKKEELKAVLKDILRGGKSTTVIDCNMPSVDDEHPTMKPVRLFGELIRNSSRKGEIVLDTFGGSGTTLIAAEQLGRRCYTMELDPHYCDVIIARWEKLTGREAVKA